jgi:hypothetical protein
VSADAGKCAAGWVVQMQAVLPPCAVMLLKCLLPVMREPPRLPETISVGATKDSHGDRQVMAETVSSLAGQKATSLNL